MTVTVILKVNILRYFDVLIVGESHAHIHIFSVHMLFTSVNLMYTYLVIFYMSTSM